MELINGSLFCLNQDLAFYDGIQQFSHLEISLTVKRMKASRVIVLGIALVAGGAAALLAARPSAPPVSVPAPTIDTTEILVAAKNIDIGQKVGPDDIGWLAWPTTSTNAEMLRKADRSDAIQQRTGFIARSAIPSGEPVREGKLVDAKGSGFMAAILPPGKRAVSTEVSVETGAGGFILPNDHVDVIVARRDREAEKRTGTETEVSETLIRDIPVRAIDQTIEEKNGVKTVVPKTATLEATPQQAETLALARKLGTVSLSLRSLADNNKPDPDPAPRNPAPPARKQDQAMKEVLVYRGASPPSVYNCTRAVCSAGGKPVTGPRRRNPYLLHATDRCRIRQEPRAPRGCLSR
jgi:pilus assembly protein CpaB